MSLAPADVPRFLVLEPGGGIRLDVRLDAPACEIDAALENPRVGRSFILMIGHPSGPFVQRVRLAGATKLLFEPGAPGVYVVLLTNPMAEPAVVRLKLRPVPMPGPGRTTRRSSAVTPRGRAKSRSTRGLYTRTD
ncbi:MAG TPA: hypothetical protein VLY85_02225 [Thermoplasmata archaeon]|nr:hypothetical protein [Thermoplasmata archaeon]HUI38426.1 hypothetical protein [Thermoplasmata archaeon]